MPISQDEIFLTISAFPLVIVLEAVALFFEATVIDQYVAILAIFALPVFIVNLAFRYLREALIVQENVIVLTVNTFA